MSIEEFQYDLRKRDEMSGNQLIISNFRSWRNDNYFDLKSINLLLGSNSSGKSSIIHALSFLKQSKLSWSLIPKSDEIDLGRVEDQVNYKTKSMRRRNKDDYIGFGLKYQKNYIAPTEWSIFCLKFVKRQMTFKKLIMWRDKRLTFLNLKFFW